MSWAIESELEQMVLDLEGRLGEQADSHINEKRRLEQELEELRLQTGRLEQLLQSSTQECLKSHELQQRMVREFAELEAKNRHLAEAARQLETHDREQQPNLAKPRDLRLPELLRPGVLEEVNSSKADLDDIKQELNQMYRDLGLQQLVISE